MTVLVLPRIPRVSGIILGANNGVDPFKSPINTTKRATRCGGFAETPRRAGRVAPRGLMALLNISVWRYVNRIAREKTRKRERARERGGGKHGSGRAGYGIL